MVFSEVKFLISLHVTVAILETGMKDQLSLRAVHATWQGRRAIPRQKTLAPTGPSLRLAHRTPPAQLIAAGSRGEGRQWRKAASKFFEVQSKETVEGLTHCTPIPTQLATATAQNHAQLVQLPQGSSTLKCFLIY